MIKVSNLSYNYKLPNNKKIAALENINLEIKKGEFIAVIGRNGCGKSTLVKHFNALLVPSDGDVWVDGINTKEKDKIWDIRRNVGMIFQNPDNQIVGTIVEEDIAFGPENLQIESEKIKERVDKALNTVGMIKFRNHPPHLLSGGQKQKVAIASVLAMHSNYIILDEATTMLDPKGRKEVLEEIKKLNKEDGLTIILITHFMEEAICADRVIVMKDGRIMADNAPYKIFSDIDLIKNARLDIPQMTKLANQLRENGIPLSRDILTIDDFVREYKRGVWLRKNCNPLTRIANFAVPDPYGEV